MNLTETEQELYDERVCIMMADGIPEEKAKKDAMRCIERMRNKQLSLFREDDDEENIT